jgi:hypothetical protein
MVEDGDAAIEALVDLDDRFGVVALVRAGQELDLCGPERDRVVVAHGALVFEAEDRLGVEAGGPGPIGSGWVRRRLGEAGVVTREEVSQEGIGSFAVGDAGQAQFGAQAILERAKEPLDTALGLGAAGGDPVDAQFRERAADLCGRGFPGQLLLEGERPLRLAPMEDAVAITVRGDRDALRLGEGVEDQEVAVSIFLIAKRGCGDLAGRIVEDRDERQPGSPLVEPGVRAAVELDEEAFLGHPLTTATVARWAPTPRAGPARLAQDAADRGPREGQAFPLVQEFLQVVVVDTDVDPRSEAHDASPDAVRDPVDGRSPAIPMDEGGQAPGAQGRAEPTDLADGSPEERGGFGHQQLAAVEGMEDCQALFSAGRQDNHASLGSVQPGEDIFADLLGRTESLTYHTSASAP